jgi:hypothetical protein
VSGVVLLEYINHIWLELRDQELDAIARDHSDQGCASREERYIWDMPDKLSDLKTERTPRS